jgi:hypothetical protein
MHHPQIDVGRFIWIWLSENVQEIVSHFTQLEEFFDFGVF